MDEDVWLEDRLFPWLADGSMGDETIDWSKRREYRAESDAGLTLSGAWLPVRTPTRFHVTLDRAARGRVDVERTADGWKATNGLDAEIERLVFRDAAGDLHLFPGPIAPGPANRISTTP